METITTQWYKTNTERYEEEKIKIEELWPEFKPFINQDGNACWTGEVKTLDQNTELFPKCEYNPLSITIECLHDYPKSNPIVYDDKEILKKHNCIHLHKNSNKICYGMRGLDENCNFDKNTKIVDLISQIGIFIFQQWQAEQNGGKWENDRLHGVLGFLEHELKKGNISIYQLCPCGRGEIYLNCCLPKVQKMLIDIFNGLKLTLPKKIGRNQKCPCEDMIKYKHCCDPRKYFIRQLLPYMERDKILLLLEGLSKKTFEDK